MVESIHLESLIRVLPRTIDELQAESETELHCEPRGELSVSLRHFVRYILSSPARLLC